MSNKKLVSIGGQALIEGIMMKGPKKTVIAVRLPNGNIDIINHKEPAPQKKYKFLGLPVIRGITAFVCSLLSGYKALMIAAEKSLPDEEDAKPNQEFAEQDGLQELPESEELVAESDAAEAEAPEADLETAKKEETKADKKDEKGGLGAFFNIILAVASVLGVALALALFMWVPSIIFNLINVAVTPGVSVNFSNVWNGIDGGSLHLYRALIEGIMKMAVFIGYVALVSLEKDIKRVFQYHGAEHKTIFCFEAGLPLTVENCRTQKRLHPRCGTSFMFLMIAVSIIISTLVVVFFPAVTKITALWVAIKILMIPLFCGVGYELLKFCGRRDNLFTKIVSAPGKWIQLLTTKEPDDKMLEVAIASIEAVVPQNGEEVKC